MSKWTNVRQGQKDEHFERIIGPFVCSVAVSPPGYWCVRVATFSQPLKNGVPRSAVGSVEQAKQDAISFVTKQLFDMCDELNLERPTAKIDTTAFMF
jgi:hypothetical protein